MKDSSILPLAQAKTSHLFHSTSNLLAQPGGSTFKIDMGLDHLWLPALSCLSPSHYDTLPGLMGLQENILISLSASIIAPLTLVYSPPSSQSDAPKCRVDHVPPLLRAFQWLPFSCRAKVIILKLTYKALHIVAVSLTPISITAVTNFPLLPLAHCALSLLAPAQHFSFFKHEPSQNICTWCALCPLTLPALP